MDEIKNLNDDDLLKLYDMVEEHLNYLRGSIISESENVEEGESQDE